MPALQARAEHETESPDEWAERGDYWLKKLNPIPQYKARKRRVLHKPLVLSGHGIRLNIDRATLLIKCGFTHYPQTREEYRFFPSDRQLPSRIVILDGDGSVTFDALNWLAEQNVPLVQIDWRGEVTGVCAANYAANPAFVERQLAIKRSAEGFEFTKWLILKKIENCQQTIRTVAQGSSEGDLTVKQLQAQADALRLSPPSNNASLLALEGIAAAAYFRYWYTLALRWKGLGKAPIPPEWLRIGSRIGSGKSNQFAQHPVNAILNYAYGVLQNQVQAQLVAKGIDPTIGLMHAQGEARQSLVFDMMEPLRPVIDCRILKFVLERTFSPSDFILNKNGICRLHPQFARFVVKSIQDMPEIEAITEANLKRLISGAEKPFKPN